MIHEIFVENRHGLVAALRACSYPTHEEAAQNPFTVSLVGHKFTIAAPRGMTDRRAEKICALIMKTPKKAFES